MHAAPRTRRQGVILLVVVSLLTLFAVVGLSFVLYAESQGKAAGLFREASVQSRADAEPELLLSFFLGELIYGTDNVHSALRGHSLAENMFGHEGPGSLTRNAVPYSGIGRFHRVYSAPPVLNQQDNFDLVNYTWFGGDNFLRDPERYDLRNSLSDPVSPRYIKGSVGYTYPDANNLFLGAVRGRDGAVLARSFHREYTSGDPANPPTLRGFGSLDRNNANWTNPLGKYLTLRPRPADHTPAFPLPEDLGGDVKNLTDSPGYLIPGTNPPQYANNDSTWLDLGFPVQVTPDGRKYKPLFAPLIQDLDSRVNVNVHGNVLGYRFGADTNGQVSVSHQGWCPGEVNLQRVIVGRHDSPNQGVPELRNLFFGLRYNDRVYNPRPVENHNHLPGRYSRTAWRDANSPRLHQKFAPGGHFYCSTDLDCYEWGRFGLRIPQPGSGQTTPRLEHDFSHGWYQDAGMDKPGHPNLYNPFWPEYSYYLIDPARVNNRSFSASNLEALLRYRDIGSPAMSSELFQLCPNSFQDAKTRRLVTTHSFDLARPAVEPTIWDARVVPYRMEPPASFPTRQAQPFPSLTRDPQAGDEFGPNWQAVTRDAANNRLAGRTDLNRGFVDYPLLNDYRFRDLVAYGNAHQSRQQMAEEIFRVLRSVTGAADPGQVAPGTPEYDALRWLAQLAVNIVDYVSFRNSGVQREGANQARVTDVMTCFNWNPTRRDSIENGWVIGTVYPRLVLNEAYVEIANVAGQQPPMASRYDVNFWVELHNPFSSNGGNRPHTHPAIPLAEDGTARLYVPAQDGQQAYAPYRVLLAKRGTDGDPITDNELVLLRRNNVLGTPVNVQAVVDNYTPDPAAGQPLELGGDDLLKVLPANTANTPFQSCNSGLNRGFFVLSPPVALPGTSGNPKFFATLPVQEQARINPPDFPGVASRMKYEYQQDNQVDFSTMQHTVVLQRLACPYLPPQPNPVAANFNPYVTVDYLGVVPPNDAVTIDGAGPHQPTEVEQRVSVGRNQPYAAHLSQQLDQAVANGAGKPRHTLFRMNHQGRRDAQDFRFAYDWLVHLNRVAISPMELLHVSGFKPSELTQQFMLGIDDATGRPVEKFRHRAPWYEPESLIWRALEFFEGGFRPQMSPIGGRFPGRINLNTIWDVETLMALADPQGTSYFTEAGVNQIFQRMLRSRTLDPNGSPGPGDRPFRGMAVAHTTNNLQYPQGSGINDTYLRPAPDEDPGIPPAQRRRLFQPRFDGAELKWEASANTNPRDPSHPYLQDELMIKTFGNSTTRSHVFAVWLTVGFFEVVNDSDRTRPPILGAEIGKAENRHIRHRMFAIVDRSRLTLDPDTPGQIGPIPTFIEARDPVLAAGAPPVEVPLLGGSYDQTDWAIQRDTRLVVDAGLNPERLTVTATQGNPNRFTATYATPHPRGFAISNAVLGHPGPQPRFDVHDDRYRGVLRYFSTIMR